jgi:RsiW-degrading membrane proteinase PrsW (M82 family)
MNERTRQVLARLGPTTPANLYSLAYAALFALSLAALLLKVWPAIVFPLSFLAAMLVITAANRTLPLRWVAVSFMYGATLVPFLAVLAAWPFNAALGFETPFRNSVVVPGVEETVKLLPLLLLLLPRRWRFARTLGITDVMIVGLAIGAGFMLWEDVLLGFYPGGVGRQSATEFLLRAHADTPHLGPLYAFPTMDVGTDNTAFIGHAAGTGYVALAIGVARFARTRFGRWAWLLPVAVWGAVAAEHGLFNYVIDRGAATGLARLLYSLGAYGRLSSYAFYLAVAVALVAERMLLWRLRRRTAYFALSSAALSAGVRGRDPLGLLAYFLDLRIYLRERRGLAYGLALYHAGGRDTTAAGRETRDYLHAVAATLSEWRTRLSPGAVEPSPAAVENA